jgi:hypothetical protein
MIRKLPPRPLRTSGLDITPVRFGWGPQSDAASLGVNWIHLAAAT